MANKFDDLPYVYRGCHIEVFQINDSTGQATLYQEQYMSGRFIALRGGFFNNQNQIMAVNVADTSDGTWGWTSSWQNPSNDNASGKYFTENNIPFANAMPYRNNTANYRYYYFSYQSNPNYHFKIVFTSSIPIICTEDIETYTSEKFELEVQADFITKDDSNSNSGDYVHMAYFYIDPKEPIAPQKIYHDIYVDGNNKPTISIHTHHNIETTTVTSNIFYNLAKDPYKLPLLLDGNYSRLGSCEYDKGMIQEFTFNQLDSLAVDNLKLGTGLMGIAKRAINEVQKGHCSIALSFRDDYVETAPNISSIYTMVAVIGEDGTHDIRPNLHPTDIPQSDNSPSSLVEIRFFDGKIPDEIKADSDNGNDTDGKNYDGSDKDYAKQDDYSSSDDMPDGNDIGSVSPWHSVYKITDIQMQSLASKIWSQDFFSILKVNENPIENIVSLKRFPFDVTGTGQSDIKIGDISTGVNGEKIVKGVYTTSKWTIDIKPKYKNFLDYYQTNLTLFLPFIGFTPLDTHIFMGKTLGVVYKIDLMSGVCKAQIYRNNDMMLERDGQCGIDIAISSSTQKQSELANAMRLSSSVADIGMGIASGNVFGVTSGIDGLLTNGVKNSFSSTSSNAPISNSSKIAPYIIYDRPITSSTNASGYPSNYKSSVGVPCGITYKLSSLSGGLNVCGNDIKFPNTLKATKEEQEMIISKLQSGVVL